MNVTNVAHAPFAFAEWAAKHGKKGETTYSSEGEVAMVVTRPWERQPCGAVRSDPFNDLIAASRIVLPTAAVTGRRDAKTLEPPWHVLLDEIRTVVPVLTAEPYELMVCYRHEHFQPKVLLCRDAGGTIGVKASFPAVDGFCESSWFDILYLSVVQEVAARVAQRPMGRMLLSWANVQEEIGLVDRMATVPMSAQEDGYGTRFAHTDLVSDDPHRWVMEVDMLRTGAMALTDPCVRRILAPVMAAQRNFGNEDLGPGRFDAARKSLAACTSIDWKTACLEWLEEAWKAHG